MKYSLATLLGVCVFSAIVCLSVATVKGVVFDRSCGGHLALAAHANTIELAKEQLQIAVKYAEENRLTSGFTSVLYRTPDEDVGFWYKNIKDSLEELESLKPDASPLERSNMLMKLRETLMSDGKEGQILNVPSGISGHPSNGLFALWFWASVVLGGVCAVDAFQD